MAIQQTVDLNFKVDSLANFVAEHILFLLIFFFSEKTSLDISCKLSAWLL